MKKQLFILLSILTLTLAEAKSANQENKPPQRPTWEEIETEKRKFLAEHMKLDEKESKAFWPLYDELRKLRGEKHKELRTAARSLKELEKNGTATQEDYKRFNDLTLQNSLEKQQLELEYYHKFEHVIPPKKIFAFYQAENLFKNKLIERMDKLHKKNRPKHP